MPTSTSSAQPRPTMVFAKSLNLPLVLRSSLEEERRARNAGFCKRAYQAKSAATTFSEQIESVHS